MVALIVQLMLLLVVAVPLTGILFLQLQKKNFIEKVGSTF